MHGLVNQICISRDGYKYGSLQLRVGPYDVTGDTGGDTLKYNPQNPIDVALQGVIMWVSLIYDAKADMHV